MKISFNDTYWNEPQQPSADTREVLSDGSIVYEDDVLMVINKPFGLLVQSNQSQSENVLDYFQKKYPDQTIYLVHRLDRPVGGLVVLAKQAAVQADLSRQMAEGKFRKFYLAVVSPAPDLDCARLIHTLKHDTKTFRCHAVPEQTPGSKKAVLNYTVLNRTSLSGQTAALLLIQLQTGRFHQIRCQLSTEGYPIIGDLKYGQSDRLPSVANPAEFPALQAAHIEFYHPVTQALMTFDAPHPTTWPWNQFDLSHTFRASSV